MASLQNLNFTCYKTFTNLSMMAYSIEIQKQKFTKVSCCEFDDSEPGCCIKFCAYFHPEGQCCSQDVIVIAGETVGAGNRIRVWACRYPC